MDFASSTTTSFPRLRSPNWDYHASNYDVENEVFFASIESFTKTDLHYRRWLSLVKIPKYLPPEAETPLLLHVAAFAGSTYFTKTLLHAGQEVDPRDVQGRTPLLWASSSGHAEIVSILLKHDVEVDAEDNDGEKPIHLAARKNYHRIVKMLSRSRSGSTFPQTKGYLDRFGYVRGGQARTKGNTAIQYICQQGHTEAVLVMIPFLQPDTLEEMLCETCSGRFESARAIFENSNASVNSKFTGATAIYLDCKDLFTKREEEMSRKGLRFLDKLDVAEEIKRR
ncbi:hypothetical protein G7Y89_g5369 [Cudoniella acicularis]|uniref:Uncharacterized protein n=1 Tax=Cudoniella acicularis TaxID=354080 RepID=A0A8H4RPP4_9HELO|nr:hypothetical protein G7Y89_g5369 [Cudoniella acicularis]